jgi:hypothetical protein
LVVKLRLTRRRVALLVVGLLLVAGGGVAYATIPGASGIISGCYDTKTGDLRVIDAEAGETCEGKESSLDWNQTGPQGEQGPPGPAGTAEAYARIAADGSVNPTFSKGITSANVSHPATGIYCLRNLGFQPKIAVGNAAATLRSDPSAPGGFAPGGFDTIVSTAVLIVPSADTVLAFCDTDVGPSQASVRIYVFQAGAYQTPAGLVDRPFSILLDE